MTVKELIEKLKEMDQSADVYIRGCDNDYDINHVEIDKYGCVAIY